MKSSNYLNWLRRLIVLGAVVAGIAVPAAGALNARPPYLGDAGDSVAGTSVTSKGLTADGLRLQGTAQVYKQLEVVRNSPTAQGIKADGLRLQGIAQTYKQIQSASAPDVFERYAATHPFGSGLSSVITPRSSTPIVRPHDAVDSARAAQALSVDQSSSGFDWGDYAIGIGTGMGLILILASGLVVTQQRRHRMLTA